MADVLPTDPDVDHEAEEARVVGVDSDDADTVLSALSSGTARTLLAELYEEPGPASDLADRTDTTIQNVQYHLQNLSEAGLIEVADTAYSEKGREMDVWVPADRALVVVPAGDEQTESVRDRLPEFLAALLPLAALSAAAELLLDGPFAPTPLPFAASTGSASGEPADVAVSEDAAGGTEAVREVAADPSLIAQLTASPGVAVFFAGLCTIAVVVLVAWYRTR